MASGWSVVVNKLQIPFHPSLFKLGKKAGKRNKAGVYLPGHVSCWDKHTHVPYLWTFTCFGKLSCCRLSFLLLFMSLHIIFLGKLLAMLWNGKQLALFTPKAFCVLETFPWEKVILHAPCQSCCTCWCPADVLKSHLSCAEKLPQNQLFVPPHAAKLSGKQS